MTRNTVLYLQDIIHFYFGVSNEKVWRTVKEDIPTILPLIEQALGELKTINP